MNEQQIVRTSSGNEQKNVSILDSFISIPYVVELQKLELVKTISACLLMARLEILFSENPEYVCKYKQPCLAQQKLGGLSFIEELGISRSVIDAAIREIVYTHRTAKGFRLAEDKFKGKFYCRYVDVLDENKTYYFRNHELVNRCLEELKANTSVQK
jgi:hypothetical protein